jgi:hypothetical protein
MKSELLFLGVVSFYIADTANDGKYTKEILKYKKYFKIASAVFVMFSMYVFAKKNPGESVSILKHFNGMLHFLPIDKDAKDLLTPFLQPREETRILTSGTTSTSRSVSGTKKKYIAANQGWKCHTCQTQLDAWFEVDHQVRLADGGSNHVDNLVALCRNCHGKKTTLENL